MKIKRVVAKGFMRFKEQQEINFPENQVTLIFGENGAGKTSVLDAICIGLYGRTFRTSFEPEAGFLTIGDLVNHDSPKASIHVEFENYGHNFIVKREISKDKSTGELLEDGEVKAQDDAVFDYVTTKAVGLDWEGFTKSTVILQGEMNALTDALPATRKEAFVKLFGLDKYGHYEQIARMEMDEKNMQVKELEAANQVLSNEVAKVPQVESSIKRLSKTIAKLEKQKEKSGKKVKQLKKLVKNLERDYKKYLKLNEKIENTSMQITNLEKMLERKKNELKQLNTLQKQLTSVKKSYNELLSITKSLKTMGSRKSKYDKLDSKVNSLKDSLKDKTAKLSELQKEIQTSKSTVSKLKKQIPSSKEIKAIREDMAAFDRRKVELEERRYQLAALLNFATNTVNELKTNMNKVKRKHTCPVCSQKIDNTKTILKHYSREIKSLESDIRKKQSQLKSVTVELRKIDQKLAAIETSKNKLESIYDRESELIEENKKLELLNRKKDQMKRDIERVKSDIEKYEKQIRMLRFDAKEYNDLEKKLSSLRQQKVAEKFSSMQTQLKQMPKLENETKKLSSNLLKMERDRKKLLSQIKKFKDIESKFGSAKENLQTAEDAHDQNVVTLTKEQTNYKTLTKQHAELKSKEKKMQSNEDEIEQLREDMSAYEELMLIFRDIPENILKRIIPYVEKEGTAVINELSEGAITALNIDPNTLNIGATMGGEVRPIHYFSGGQQTRINMALRIAISRILTRMPQTDTKASATMQTLFIDEGDFGNLDEAGVRDTMGVIHNLTREFNRIILISHLETVRSNFQGYTIEVVKSTPSQSVINTPLEAISV